MSREAIAAALAREDLACGERLVAFSLASFADRANRARPGTPAAAARAGLARSGFLEARDRLVRRGLIVVEDQATGRGRASTVALQFAETGPWWEGEINADLFEAVLGYSPARGPARVLLAAMAALAGEQGVVEGVTTGRLCAAAGVADRTYRRARAALLASGEVFLRGGSGGRGNTNWWEIPDPRTRIGAAPPAQGRRGSPPTGARPLMAAVAVPVAGEGEDPEAVPVEAAADARSRAVRGAKGGQDRTVSTPKGPVLTGVSTAKGGHDRTLPVQNRPDLTGVSAGKGGQGRTLPAETPAKTPAETPAPNARAGREPQNPRTKHPPNPPFRGGSDGQLFVEEPYVTERGRARRRWVPVDLDAVRERLRAAGEADLSAWEQARACLRDAVGESTFEVWLARLDLIAVDVEGTLVLLGPPEWVAWIASRFPRVLDGAARSVGRRLRIADELERAAAEALSTTATAAVASAAPGAPGHRPFGEHGAPEPRAAETPPAMCVNPPPGGLIGSRAEQSIGKSACTSAYPSSYTDVYTQAKEVSG